MAMVMAMRQCGASDGGGDGDAAVWRWVCCGGAVGLCLQAFSYGFAHSSMTSLVAQFG
jgi:hypothetical protein